MIYARSDIHRVSVSESHGGCGQEHARPTDAAGNPVQVWGLACPACEGYLRTDRLWSAEIDRIPETFDEVQAREVLAKRGPRDAYAILAAAIGQLAGMDTAALTGPVTRGALGPAPVTGKMACPAGHVQSAGQRFCGECGAPMRGTVPAAALAGAEAAA